jgi:hypothetical protein
MSPISALAKTVLPAPMKVIFEEAIAGPIQGVMTSNVGASVDVVTPGARS